MRHQWQRNSDNGTGDNTKLFNLSGKACGGDSNTTISVDHTIPMIGVVALLAISVSAAVTAKAEENLAPFLAVATSVTPEAADPHAATCFFNESIQRISQL